MRRALLAFALIPLVGLSCTERISGPEAVRAIEELESARTVKDARRLRRLLDRIGWLAPVRDLRNLSFDTVAVRRDGQVHEYQVTVFERVMHPVQLDPRDRCASVSLDRRSALLWSEDRQALGMEFRGGDFTRPVGPSRGNCSTLRLIGPEPFLLLAPDPDDPDQDGWQGESGHVDISPGVVVGNCEFLASDVLQHLREKMGVTCNLTRHTIAFSAVARRGDQTISVDLSPTEVLGIRYILHCDGSDPSVQDLCKKTDGPWLEP
jgi:hypothetical protein